MKIKHFWKKLTLAIAFGIILAKLIEFILFAMTSGLAFFITMMFSRGGI